MLFSSLPFTSITSSVFIAEYIKIVFQGGAKDHQTAVLYRMRNTRLRVLTYELKLKMNWKSELIWQRHCQGAGNVKQSC